MTPAHPPVSRPKKEGKPNALAICIDETVRAFGDHTLFILGTSQHSRGKPLTPKESQRIDDVMQKWLDSVREGRAEVEEVFRGLGLLETVADSDKDVHMEDSICDDLHPGTDQEIFASTSHVKKRQTVVVDMMGPEDED